MAMTFLVSFIFEMYGRRMTLFLSFLFTACFIALIPYTSPHYYWLIAVRCAIGITMAGPTAHPLIPDYVKRQS